MTNLAETLIGKTIKTIRPVNKLGEPMTDVTIDSDLIDWGCDTEISIEFTDGTQIFIYHSEWGSISTKSQLSI
jgi:hypothetical protein